jgi:uncharacterized hydrophobic protein (TIGR00271 family)
VTQDSTAGPGSGPAAGAEPAAGTGWVAGEGPIAGPDPAAGAGPGGGADQVAGAGPAAGAGAAPASARPAPGTSAERLGRLLRTPGRWGRRPQLSAGDRRSAMDALMMRPSPAALRRFVVLLCLSVVVASVGLVQDSTAVVIGAMMIAPLMAPIMGIAASLVMGWGTRLLRSLLIVTLSVIGAVAIAWLIAGVMPAADTGLPAEVLARSSPDVRDLLVALAAGAAGAYATMRRDVSGALPGVAVAVALVPPLGCVGTLLGRGQPDLALGAALLFLTNLFGIILAAAVVFVLTGFVPEHRFRAAPRRILVTLAAAAVPALAVGVVLTVRFIDTAQHARQLEAATRTVVGWLGPGDDLNRITLAGATVQVNVSGKTAPPQVQALTDALTTALGHPTTVDLRWTPVRDVPTARATVAPLALNQLRPVVEQWLAGQSLTLDGLSYDSTALVVSCSGAQPPEKADGLAALLETRFGSRPPINLAWTRTATTITATGGTGSPTATARQVAAQWAAAHPGTAVLAVDQSGEAVTVTIIGTVRPAIDDLQAELQVALPRLSLTVQWVTGSILSQSTPAPPPTPAPSGSRPAPAVSAGPTR